jgi:TolB-like protein/tetratricopeptide (TPR) repeat protein
MPLTPKGVPATGAEDSRRPDDKLLSWKEIANYLGRDVRTVQRWERTEGMPVERHKHLNKSTVYAYKSELDKWIHERQPADDPAADASFQPEPEDEDDAGEDSMVQGIQPVPRPPVALAPAGPGSPLKSYQRAPLRLALGIFVALVVLAAGYAAYNYVYPKPRRPDKARLAVLPLGDPGGNPEQKYFSEGLTDELITQLGRVNPQRLGVIAGTSSRILAGRPIREISQTLKVQYVVEGSVHHGGNQVRIDIQLIQASDETHLWADSFTRDTSDILRVESEVASDVARRIAGALPMALPKPSAVDPAAHDAYLRGRFYWSSRHDFQKSIESFEEALQKDPSYASAYAGLAGAYALLGQVPNDAVPPREAKPKARLAAQRAFQLDRDNVEAHAVMGNVSMSYDWDLNTAEQEYHRAIELNPNEPSAHEWYGHLLIVEGRFDEAVVEMRRALDVDPVSPILNTALAEAYYFSRRYDEAIAEARRTIDSYPQFWWPYIWLGCALREEKKYGDAVDAFRHGRELSGDNLAMIMFYGHAQAMAGNVVEAQAAIHKLEQLRAKRFVPSLYLAAVHLGLGETKKTLDLLDEAYQERIDRLIFLGVDPIADPLRSNLRFQDLLHRVGLPST